MSHFDFRGDTYFWYAASIGSSPYKYYLLHREESHDLAPFKHIGSRLFVTAIIVLWIATWGALILFIRGIDRKNREIERLAAFPEKSPDIVLSLDAKGALQYLNPYGHRLLDEVGLSESGISALLPPDYHALLERCMELGSPSREIEAEYGGRSFLWTFSPTTSRDLVHCYAREITDHKRAEEQAKKAQFEKSAAEATSQAKSMFLANMSHEIRTPLTAIIGFSEALLNVKQSKVEQLEAINTIHRTGKHLLTIINDILDLSKIEAGGLEVERVSVPLFELVEEVAAMARHQVESKSIQFFVDPSFPLPKVIQSDPVRIRQILLNLLSNAIKFTERGKITLRVRYDTENGRLALQVADTGVGIKPEHLSRIFNPFTQADAGTARRFGGTGLGLSLSKQLAEMLGGTITVESNLDQGSCFTFTLDAGPVSILINSPEEAQQVRQPSMPDDNFNLLTGTLLVAEDNPDNQRLIALNARYLGVEVKMVENGEMAVAEALANPYDLILMDMHMPIMDGLTAVRVLRSKGYSGPIIALTADATLQSGR